MIITNIARVSSLIFVLSSYACQATADINSNAETVLSWAENNFPTLLTPVQATKSIPGWLYRYYAPIDFYVGINVNDKNVYYTSGKDLSQGIPPNRYISVANLISSIELVNANPSITIENAKTFFY